MESQESRLSQTGGGNQSATDKEVFLRLHPVLGLLLSSIERYRQLTSKEGMYGSQNKEDMALGIFQTQVKLLTVLTKNMNELAALSSKHCQGLALMADYVCLPLYLILQSIEWTEPPALKVTQLMVRRSAHWKSVQGAAESLSTYVGLCKNSTSTMSSQFVRCLMQCAASLSADHLIRIEKQLDRGDNCICAILQCMESLLGICRDGKRQDIALGRNHAELLVPACIRWLKDLPLDQNDSTRYHHTWNPNVQLQALSTLEATLVAIPEGTLWQPMFPDVSATLFLIVLTHVRHASAKIQPRMASRAVDVLSNLLRIALGLFKKDEPSNASTADNLLNRIQAMGGKPVDRLNGSQGAKDTTEEGGSHDPKTFQSEINTRLPRPLKLVLALLPTSLSPALRLASLSLCRVVLLEIRHVWNETGLENDLEQAALDCCLVLNHDTDERVATGAKKVLSDYKSNIGKEEWENHIGSVMAPRVVDLFRELSVVAKSQRETEMQAKLALIRGYLDLLSSSAGGNRSALATNVVTDEIRDILCGIFDVNFESIDNSPTVVTVGSIHQSLTPRAFRSRYLSEKTERNARLMARSLGTALGIKQASLLVDTLVADLFQACLSRVEEKLSVHGPQHIEWLHERVGLAIVANEILIGSVGPTSMTSGCISKKVRRVLIALCKALFPIITSAPLWTLPTIFANIVNMDTNEANDRTPLPNLRALNLQQETYEKRTPFNQFAVSSSALSGNAVMLVSLFQLIGTLTEFIGQATVQYLPTLLYPLCERISSRNHSLVQGEAVALLRAIAVVCSVNSVEELLRKNFDLLISSATSKLHQFSAAPHSYADYPFELASITRAILRNASSCSEEDSIEVCNFPKKRSMDEAGNVAYAIELVRSLTARYDRSFASTNTGQGFEIASLELVQVLHATVSYNGVSLGFSYEGISQTDKSSAENEMSEPWMELLEPFRTHIQTLSNDDVLSPKEGFEEHRERSNPNHTERDILEVSDGELDFLDLVLQRCSFSLSHQSLRVQLASCEAMESVFHLLGYIAIHYEEKPEEANGPKTAINRNIAASWTPITDRIRRTSSFVVGWSNRTPVVSLRLKAASSLDPAPVDSSSQLVFLSRLLNLVASMCEASDDFMARRVRDDIWPIVKRVFRQYLPETADFHAICDKVADHPVVPAPPSTEDKALLLTLVKLFSRVFSHRNCGTHLADLIAEAGAILMPFLSDSGSVGSEAVHALEAMAAIDGDALTRALLISSGLEFPQKALDMYNWQVQCPTDETSLLESRARHLLSFIDSLPEPVFI